jgi:hypothetical protein
MNCSEFNDYLARTEGDAAKRLPPEATEHLAACQGCRSLWSYLSSPQEEAALPAGLCDRIIPDMLDDLQPVSATPAAITLVLGFLIVFTLLILAAVSVTGARGAADLQNWQLAGVLAVLSAGAGVLAVVLSREMVPAERRVLAPGKAAVTIVVSLVLSLTLLFPWKVEDQFAAMGWHCAQRGLLFAFPAALLFLLVLRRGAVLSPETVGALTGLFAGLVGVGVLHFNCMIHNAPHLVVWHAGVPLACAGAGYLVGQYLWIVWPSTGRRL